ncbi:MAG: SRPBCC family protein [Pseudonocardia sp.]|nr:SRPBCC family protein [Pseudonocardia sp.]
MTDRGTYVEHEGRAAVRFVRSYPHAAERVWAAVSEPAELRHWFPSHVELERRAGGRIAFGGDPNLPAETGGVVLAYDPPRRLAFTWGGDELHLSVEPDGEKACTLTLLNVLAARDTAARNAAGWTVCLAELDKHLGGAAAGGPHSDTAEPWQEHYAAYVAAGVPSGAPTPG